MPNLPITGFPADLSPALVDLVVTAKSPFGAGSNRKVTLQSIADLISTTSVTLQEAYDSGNTIDLANLTPIQFRDPTSVNVIEFGHDLVTPAPFLQPLRGFQMYDANGVGHSAIGTIDIGGGNLINGGGIRQTAGTIGAVWNINNASTQSVVDMSTMDGLSIGDPGVDTATGVFFQVRDGAGGNRMRILGSTGDIQIGLEPGDTEAKLTSGIAAGVGPRFGITFENANIIDANNGGANPGVLPFLFNNGGIPLTGILYDSNVAGFGIGAWGYNVIPSANMTGAADFVTGMADLNAFAPNQGFYFTGEYQTDNGFVVYLNGTGIGSRHLLIGTTTIANTPGGGSLSDYVLVSGQRRIMSQVSNVSNPTLELQNNSVNLTDILGTGSAWNMTTTGILQFGSTAGDPLLTSDGQAAYNNATDRFRVRANGATESLAYLSDVTASDSLQEAYTAGGAGGGAILLTNTGGAMNFTAPDTVNVPTLVLNQNDITNNPVALQINNTGTGNDITATNWNVGVLGDFLGRSATLSASGLAFNVLAVDDTGITVGKASAEITSTITGTTNSVQSLNITTSQSGARSSGTITGIDLDVIGNVGDTGGTYRGIAINNFQNGSFLATKNALTIGIDWTNDISASNWRVETTGAATFNYNQNVNAYFRVLGVGNTDLFFVDTGSDRVGIGTLTPGSIFNVVGGRSFFGGTNTDVTGTNDVVVFNDQIVSISATADASLLSIHHSGGIVAGISGTGTYNPMTFYTGGSERVRITTAGRVGIGNTAPNAELDVTGSIYLSDILQVGSVAGAPTLTADGQTKYNSTSDRLIFRANAVDQTVAWLSDVTAADEWIRTGTVLSPTAPGDQIAISGTSTATSHLSSVNAGVFTGLLTGSQVYIANTNASTSGTQLYVTSNAGASASGSMTFLEATSASFDQQVLRVDSAGTTFAQQILTTGTGGGLYLNQNNATARALFVESDNTASNAVEIVTDAATTGGALFVTSGSTSTATRTLVDVSSTSAAATGATVLKVTNASTGLALDVVGNSRFSGRVLGAKGADVASASNITLGTDGNVFDITGTTTINTFTATGWTAGSMIVLQFDGALTLTHNSGGANDFMLAGSANLATAALTRLMFYFDGTDLIELSRTVA